jgi:hypothetical protein
MHSGLTIGRPDTRVSRWAWALTAALLLCSSDLTDGQVMSALRGRVFDGSGGPVAAAVISVRDESTGFDLAVECDADGRYTAAIPAGTYTVTSEATGFRTEVILELAVDVGRTLVRDFHLAVGDRTETVVVRGESPLIDRATATVGHVVTAATVQDIPLNGRHFTDLGVLVPGSVAPSQSGFSSRPLRGTGALAVNTAGNREEAVSFLVNGVSTNNLTFGSLMFEPPLTSVQEFKVDNAAFSPEHGHVSGAIVTIATRSGTDDFRGGLFEFLRNDALDARNFFEFTSPDPNPFERHQFGGFLGGPIRRDRTFFFASYEGLRQRQGVDVNSLVLSDEQRAAATDAVIQRLIPLIPRANYFDSAGTPRFVGSAPAVVDSDRWTLDVRHTLGENDQFHGFYGSQRVRGREPTSSGNSIPGFGHIRRPLTSILTVSHTHVFAGGFLNDARFGRSTLRGGSFPATPFNPVDFGIRNGVVQPLGLPQMIVAGDLNFGGPGMLPQGRDDTSYVFAETASLARGRHSIKFGGEYRHFVNENFAEGTGTFNFPTVAAFLAGIANAFTITLGHRRNHIDQRAMALFFQNTVTIRRNVTLEVGMRYDWHVTPTERNGGFVVFDGKQAALVRVGEDLSSIYQQNNRNFEPRVGVAWDLSTDGRTVVHAAYARAVDQPSTSAVRDTAGNPPFAIPLTASGAIPLAAAIDRTRPAGLAPMTVDPEFKNAALQSWHANLQRQLAATLAATVGYMGSRGRNLRISRNINQPVSGVLPFPALSSTSPILPGSPLGIITQVESSGFSNYNAAWVSLTKRISRGLQFDASYTLSKSLDTNSLNSSGFAVQNGYDIPGQYGLSDFDSRHRFVLSAIYSLPFTGTALTRDWQLAAVVQSQSGNPVNIVTGNSRLNGLPNTVRPDLIGPIRLIGTADQWFDPSAFVEVDRFGNLGRNTVIGPAFHNTDFSLIKRLQLGAPFDGQLRLDVFDLFNHPNFGPPGNVVGTPTFGKITRTRLPTGEAGSSRQIQLAIRLTF